MIGFYLILLGKLLNFNFCVFGYLEYPPVLVADITRIRICIFFCGSKYRNTNLDPDFRNPRWVGLILVWMWQDNCGTGEF